MDFVENLFVQQQKGKITNNLAVVVDSTRDSLAKNQDAVNAEKVFMKALYVLIKNEAPDYKDAIKPIIRSYHRALHQEDNLIMGKTRSIEDLNDIQERFAVVVRASQRYQNAKHALKESTRSLADAKARRDQEIAKGGNKVDKLQVAVADAIQYKKDCIENLKKEINIFIEEKQKFNKFRIRRMRHSFKCYGESTAQCLENEIKFYNEVIDGLTKILENPVPHSNAGPTESEESKIESASEQPAAESPDPITESTEVPDVQE